MSCAASLRFYRAQIAGEHAFCRHFGIPFEPDEHGGVNLVLDGCSIEIQPSENTSKPTLRFERRNDFRKDVTVLTVLTGDTCRLIGWIDLYRFRSLFKAAAALGFGVRALVLDRGFHLPMEELRTFITEKERLG
jgi:hypothetical protein